MCLNGHKHPNNIHCSYSQTVDDVFWNREFKVFTQAGHNKYLIKSILQRVPELVWYPERGTLKW